MWKPVLRQHRARTSCGSHVLVKVRLNLLNKTWDAMRSYTICPSSTHVLRWGYRSRLF